MRFHPGTLRLQYTVAILSLLPAAFAAQVATGVSDPAATTAIARFDSMISADVDQDGVGGVTAAVVRDTVILWAKGFGYANRDTRAPADVATIYRTGSISKTFTAVLLMQLVDRGVVRLDDAVVDDLPEFAELDAAQDQVRSITLRQLASHTGGLIREPQLEGAAAGPIQTWESKILESIPNTGLRSPPGSEYSYSNIGFGILGLTLSRAAGKPFIELIEGLIFEPLMMGSSTFVIGDNLAGRLSVGYANGRDGTIGTAVPLREHDGRGYKVPNGGIYSTVGDLRLFIASLQGVSDPDIITAGSRREMLSIQTPEASTSGYGLGLSIRTSDSGRRFFGHGGSVAGYNAYMVFEPQSGWGVVLLRNYNSGGNESGESCSRAVRGAGE
jgi:CubicO group peptidase (beta-lactamase class C family)